MSAGLLILFLSFCLKLALVEEEAGLRREGGENAAGVGAAAGGLREARTAGASAPDPPGEGAGISADAAGKRRLPVPTTADGCREDPSQNVKNREEHRGPPFLLGQEGVLLLRCAGN